MFFELDDLKGKQITNEKNEIEVEDEEQLLNDNLKQIINNFMSSEYLLLLTGVINTIDDRNLNTNLKYKSSQVCQSMFEFTSAIIFSKRATLDSIFAEQPMAVKATFFANYNNDVNEMSNLLKSSVFSIRETSLNCFNSLINERNVAQMSSAHAKQGNKYFMADDVYETLKHRLIVARFDVEASNRPLADKAWTSGKFETTESLCLSVVDDLVSPVEHLRISAAEALAHMIKSKHLNVISKVLKMLIDLYDKFNVLIEPKRDQFGRVSLNEHIVDEWEARTGIANALTHLAEIIPTTSEAAVLEIFQFFVRKSLNDRNQFVRNKMLEASIAALNFHGKNNINSLLPLFENFLQDAPKDATYDSVRQNVVILMGTLAKHLDKDDPKVAPIIGKLVQALQTPSQQVQEAVANCLPPLMPSIKNQV